MTDCLENRLQEYASVGIPGAWIIEDESVEATISKIGGFPKYFYLWQKTKEQIECLSCHQKMFLLTQLNAPLIDELSQRNIYVFMCRNPKCTKTNKGWKVIVQRGPKIDQSYYLNNNNNNNNNHNNHENESSHCDIYKMINKHNKNKNKNKNKNEDKESFWNHDLNQNEKVINKLHETMDNKITTKMNELNDDFSRLMAMQQKLLNDMDYKGKEKKNNNNNHKGATKKHKNTKSSKQQKASLKNGCFVPFEIAFNDEQYYKNKMKQDTNNKIIKWNNKEIDLNKYLNEDDNEIKDLNGNNTESDDDEKEDLFSNYLERIGLNKSQCIRYCYGDAPLTPYNNCNNAKIPNCIHCGSKKVFEFQIMSTTLMYLEPKQIDHEWLTILVFVCPKTCQQSGEEFVFVCNEA